MKDSIAWWTAVGLLVVVSIQPAAGQSASGAGDSSGSDSAVRTDGVASTHTEADVRFLRGMIRHHAQAVQMAGLALQRSRNDTVRLVAERIDVSQRDEITWMRGWLERRGERPPHVEFEHAGRAPAGHASEDGRTEGHGQEGGAPANPSQLDAERSPGAPDHLRMPGMLSDEQLDRLAESSGTEFDRLFLEFMIHHHEGALTMVAELLARDGAAQEPDLFRFVSDVDADQRAEISRMRAMLNRL